jgi:hypothetical protein
LQKNYPDYAAMVADPNLLSQWETVIRATNSRWNRSFERRAGQQDDDLEVVAAYLMATSVKPVHR